MTVSSAFALSSLKIATRADVSGNHTAYIGRHGSVVHLRAIWYGNTEISSSSPLPCSTSSGAFLQSAVVTDFTMERNF